MISLTFYTDFQIIYLMKLLGLLSTGILGVFIIGLALFAAVYFSNDITGHVTGVCNSFSVDSDYGFFVKGSSIVSGCSPAFVSDFCVNPCVVGEYVGSSLIHVNCLYGCVDGACLHQGVNPSLAQYCADRVGGQDVEDCDNGEDDDNDGDTDCDDVIDCESAPNCVVNPPVANCSDKIKNQNETGIDCGGYFCLACLGSGKKYYVSNSGSDSNNGLSEQNPIKTIAKVNSLGLMQGDNVLFKADNKFIDAVLVAKKGVTYASYGGGKAVIGDPNLSTSSEATIKVDETGVTIDNLKVYGYEYGWNVISYSKGDLIISNNEIIGGRMAHSRWRNGIQQTDAATPIPNIKIIRNKIHGFGGRGILLSMPYNIDIGYNEIYDLWVEGAQMDQGAHGIGVHTSENGRIPTDTWDTNYTFRIHHNNIHDFEYVAIAGGLSRVLVEYNEIHHNLDERIYRGGVKHGSIGKMWDAQGHNMNESSATGKLGLVFRYNYVHDLVRRGEAGYTYGVPSQWHRDIGIPNVTSTKNGLDRAVYLYAVNQNPDYNNYGLHYGDGVGEGPDTVISGMGYGNFWIHNNIFFNCSNQILKRNIGYDWPFREDLRTYFVSNTILDSGWKDYLTNYGVLIAESDANSPHTVVNNIIDFTNPTAAYAGRWRARNLTLGHNIYTRQQGIIVGKGGLAPAEPGDNYASAFEYRAVKNNQSIITSFNEQYKTEPGWNNPQGRIFAPNIGVDGAWIPDVRLKVGGNANNKGMDYDLIGDTSVVKASYWTDGPHKLGQDPTGRSFAYDILGNYRTTNDVGAVGVK